MHVHLYHSHLGLKVPLSGACGLGCWPALFEVGLTDDMASLLPLMPSANVCRTSGEAKPEHTEDARHTSHNIRISRSRSELLRDWFQLPKQWRHSARRGDCSYRR